MNLINKFKKSDKYTKYSIYIIILFSVIVFSLTSVYHVSGDGCWHVPVGKFIATHGKFPLFEPLGRDEPFWSPPLYHIIVAAVYYFFSAFNHNAANFAIKFISPIFGILTLIFSFLVIKKLTNSKISFYSTIFLAFIPIFIDYSVLSYVESSMTFFVILSVYFLINEKIFLSGISVGLSILAKYNGIFILPALIYYLYKKYNRKSFYKNSAIIVIVSLLVASPWIIRNWLLLGNPIWPFLNFIFHGYQIKSYSVLNIKNLISWNLVTFTVLGVFGVPDGNPAAFRFVSWMPNIISYIVAWVLIITTFMFLLYIFISKKSVNYGKDVKKFLKIWILSYLVLLLVYIANVGFSVSRIILPAFPAIAIFCGLGLNNFIENLKTKKNKILVFSLIALIIILFIFTLIFKTLYAASLWNSYNSDFEWVKSGTNEGSVFIANGQCIPYNIERTSLYFTGENLNKADYVWVNQNFFLDRRSILNDNELKELQSKNYNVAYSNKNTGTIIYTIKH
ncbi:MAG TPA: glycosyltransferase family 39 protein [Candidatus Nanoarchaeia archaeon]|nr:glycosyltransferase family 39 protein [Candidatus Nanoarchaeia archaeon]